MSLGYAWEQLHSAVDLLATGTGSIQKRLEQAYLRALIRVKPEEDLPADLCKDFQGIVDLLAKDGSAEAFADSLTDAGSCRAAAKIVTLFDDVARRDAVTEQRKGKRHEV